eukprot:816477-Pleurochrysis_carterae.AAC.3
MHQRLVSYLNSGHILSTMLRQDLVPRVGCDSLEALISGHQHFVRVANDPISPSSLGSSYAPLNTPCVAALQGIASKTGPAASPKLLRQLNASLVSRPALLLFGSRASFRVQWHPAHGPRRQRHIVEATPTTPPRPVPPPRSRVPAAERAHPQPYATLDSR